MAWCLTLGPAFRPVLLSHTQGVRLLQPGPHHPHLDSREPPAAVGWGWEGGRAGNLWAARWALHISPWLDRGEAFPLCCLCLLLCESEMDSCPGHPSRLLQLNGAPQALTFCSNSGDLVLALGSRLCLVSHRLYLPTSYLVEVGTEPRVGRLGLLQADEPLKPGLLALFTTQNLCQKIPDVVDDPPLPLTGQESLTSAQLQRLANLHGGSSFRSVDRPG